jgi:magnesium and cobalt transporter
VNAGRHSCAVIESGHSRYPVVDDREKVLGILLEICCARCEDERISISECCNAVFIPESKRLNVLLKGSAITITWPSWWMVCRPGSWPSDVLEQIVGDIGDEYDIDDELDVAAKMPVISGSRADAHRRVQ